MLWIETKYACLIASRVRNYERKSSTLWNFSCPICNDSSTDKRKARGYIYETKGHLRFHCHNCSSSMPFTSFIREIDESLYLDMKREMFSEQNEKKDELKEFTNKLKKPDYVKGTNFKELKKISQLSPNHVAKKFIDKRQIPTTWHHQLFFCEKFKEWTNTLLPGKFDPIKYEEPRIIIPFLSKNKSLIGYQGRDLSNDPKAIRYITIMLNEDQPRIFGLDKVDTNRRYYALEGPFDAMFLENAVASCGSDIVSELEKAKLSKDNGVIVYDNEPRNRDTIKKINKAIRKGWRVVIWPDSISEKDVNDMFLAGLPVKEIIAANTFKGLEAELKMATWKKV